MDINTEVLTPIWVLKQVVERDYEEWAMFNKPSAIVVDELYTAEMEEDEEPREKFPIYDSTARMLGILEKYDVHFNKDSGEWSDE